MPSSIEQETVARQVLEDLAGERATMTDEAARQALSNECRRYFRDVLAQPENEIDEFLAQVGATADPIAELTATVAMQRTTSHFGLDLLVMASCARPE